jgi:hypothetical protein
MQYEGKLYGKVGRKYIPLAIDSAEVDRLQEREKKCPTIDDAEKIALVRALQEIRDAIGLIGDVSPRQIVDVVKIHFENVKDRNDYGKR